MSITSKSTAPRLKYHQGAYQFVFAALRYTQERLGRDPGTGSEDEHAHISGQELLQGIRQLALEQFGLMAVTIFRQWGITCTEDFGRIVFELVDRGEMRKTDRDDISDFYEVYDFDEALDRRYVIDTGKAFH
jgi:uncharacterized repeat protein (TIGR04138 family)